MPVIWSTRNSKYDNRVIMCQSLHKIWKCLSTITVLWGPKPSQCCMDWSCMIWQFDDHKRQWHRSLVSDSTSCQVFVWSSVTKPRLQRDARGLFVGGSKQRIKYAISRDLLHYYCWTDIAALMIHRNLQICVSADKCNWILSVQLVNKHNS